MGRISLGVLGATPPELLEELAPRLEAAGFSGLWLNDPGHGDPLAGLAAAARVTSTLRVGIGVLPLARTAPDEILRELDANGVPQVRTVVGVGAAGRGALARAASALDTLGAAGWTTALGALGPKMRALGARSADHLVLNWLTPALAAAARVEARDLAAEAGRSQVHVALYVRTVVDPDARPRLEAEAARYARIPAYAANFARHGLDPMSTTIAPSGNGDGNGIGDQLQAFDGAVDELVLRAVTPNSTLEDYLRFAEHPDIARLLGR